MKTIEYKTLTKPTQNYLKKMGAHKHPIKYNFGIMIQRFIKLHDKTIRLYRSSSSFFENLEKFKKFSSSIQRQTISFYQTVNQKVEPSSQQLVKVLAKGEKCITNEGINADKCLNTLKMRIEQMNKLTSIFGKRTQLFSSFLSTKKKLAKINKNKKPDHNKLLLLTQKVSEEKNEIKQMDQLIMQSLIEICDTENKYELLTIKTFLSTFNKTVLSLSLQKAQNQFESFTEKNNHEPNLNDINPFTKILDPNQNQKNEDEFEKKKKRKKKKKKKDEDDFVNDDLTKRLFEQPQPLIEPEKIKQKKKPISKNNKKITLQSQNYKLIKYNSQTYSSSTGSLHKTPKKHKLEKYQSDSMINTSSLKQIENIPKSTKSTNSKKKKDKKIEKQKQKQKKKQKKFKPTQHFHQLFDFTANEPFLVIKHQDYSKNIQTNNFFDHDKTWDVMGFDEDEEINTLSWNNSFKMRNQFEEPSESDNEF
ncbi:transcription initiation factor tfiid subunit [Anaeramoeba flamelloides]|uniref:Transcription initiation factor tfiid subunit n=1 Tax=Anaeramoeba flamelloides TaxID=1746091 RepID=A0AAV7Z6B8_9EUKA|nr:transcription initiation factor tfiid subunit [Anaeramoeba flamelloides]